MRRIILLFLMTYMAAAGAFAGFGIFSIEDKIETARTQAVGAVLIDQNIKVLSEIRI